MAAHALPRRSASKGRRVPIGDMPPIRKSLGQHFLNDGKALGRIVDALQLTGEETVIEIGPGRGALTERLVPLAKRLLLVEYDRMLAAKLRERYASRRRRWRWWRPTMLLETNTSSAIAEAGRMSSWE